MRNSSTLARSRIPLYSCWITALLVTVHCSGQDSSERVRPPNVILMTLDTLRADHLGCYGNPTIHTPSLDAFAEKSIRFDRHYMAGFPTMPARAAGLRCARAGGCTTWPRS